MSFPNPADRTLLNRVDLALIQGAQQGDADLIHSALEQGARPHASLKGCTALQWAATNGHPACVKLLIGSSDPKQLNSEHLSALHLAAEKGHLECCRLLLDWAGLQGVGGRTPLQMAAENGHTDCVRLLLTVSDAAHADFHGDTALHSAAMNGHLDCLSLLLHEVGVDTKNRQGQTALHLAARFEQLDCLIHLVSRSTLDQQDHEGLTALHYLSDQGCTDGVSLLLAHQPSLARIPNRRKELPLHRAAARGHSDCLWHLLPYSPPQALDGCRQTAAALATLQGHPHCADLIQQFILLQSEQTELDLVIPPAPPASPRPF